MLRFVANVFLITNILETTPAKKGKVLAKVKGAKKIFKTFITKKLQNS